MRGPLIGRCVRTLRPPWGEAPTAQPAICCFVWPFQVCHGLGPCTVYVISDLLGGSCEYTIRYYTIASQFIVYFMHTGWKCRTVRSKTTRGPLQTSQSAQGNNAAVPYGQSLQPRRPSGDDGVWKRGGLALFMLPILGLKKSNRPSSNSCRGKTSRHKIHECEEPTIDIFGLPGNGRSPPRDPLPRESPLRRLHVYKIQVL